MGSKKLKAVVVKGNIPISIADPEGMKALRKQHLPVFKEEFGSDLTEYGTPMFYEEALNSGDAPWKNWSASVEEMKGFTVTAEKVKDYQLKRYACSGCPVGCGGHVEVKQGPFKTEGPVHKAEYETMGMFGSNLLNDNLEAIIRINDLCNRYGLDTIGTGALVAYATECYERGLIGKEQTGGLELGWGREEAVVALVEKIGKAEGVGVVLAKGFEEAVRGEALPAHDPRWNVGLALTYHMDPTPARHTQGSTAFPIAGYDMPEIGATEAAGRARQIFNVKAGWTVDRYDFPERVLGIPPLDGGGTKGVTVDLQTMVKEYIETEGLDPTTGLSSRESLEALDLAHFLD